MDSHNPANPHNKKIFHPIEAELTNLTDTDKDTIDVINDFARFVNGLHFAKVEYVREEKAALREQLRAIKKQIDGKEITMVDGYKLAFSIQKKLEKYETLTLDTFKRVAYIGMLEDPALQADMQIALRESLEGEKEHIIKEKVTKLTELYKEFSTHARFAHFMGDELAAIAYVLDKLILAIQAANISQAAEKIVAKKLAEFKSARKEIIACMQKQIQIYGEQPTLDQSATALDGSFVMVSNKAGKHKDILQYMKTAIDEIFGHQVVQSFQSFRPDDSMYWPIVDPLNKDKMLNKHVSGFFRDYVNSTLPEKNGYTIAILKAAFFNLTNNSYVNAILEYVLELLTVLEPSARFVGTALKPVTDVAVDIASTAANVLQFKFKRIYSYAFEATQPEIPAYVEDYRRNIAHLLERHEARKAGAAQPPVRVLPDVYLGQSDWVFLPNDDSVPEQTTYTNPQKPAESKHKPVETKHKPGESDSSKSRELENLVNTENLESNKKLDHWKVDLGQSAWVFLTDDDSVTEQTTYTNPQKPAESKHKPGESDSSKSREFENLVNTENLESNKKLYDWKNEIQALVDQLEKEISSNKTGFWGCASAVRVKLQKQSALGDLLQKSNYEALVQAASEKKKVKVVTKGFISRTEQLLDAIINHKSPNDLPYKRELSPESQFRLMR